MTGHFYQSIKPEQLKEVYSKIQRQPTGETTQPLGRLESQTSGQTPIKMFHSARILVTNSVLEQLSADDRHGPHRGLDY